jgi:hypothetical protein
VVELIREHYGPNGTEGMLYVDGHKFFTLEEPWKDNKPSVSCIPVGEYQVAPWNWAGDKRFKYSRTWQVLNVPKRSGILIHSGNTIKDTRGCVLIGNKRGWLDGLPAVLESKLALNRLRDILGEKEFTLTIKDGT